MSFEVLEKLEAKIQTAVDTIALLQMEVEELKEEKEKLAVEANELRSSREEIEQKDAADATRAFSLAGAYS